MVSSNVLGFLAIYLLSAKLVNAHGYVHQIDVGGQSYTGCLPFNDPYQSPLPVRIVRHIPSDGPVTDVQDTSLGCNVGGNTPTQAVADAPAGGQITFEWDYWPSDHLGPVSVYMASCNGNCTDYDSTQAQWFKVEAQGYDGTQNQWASAALIANNATWSTTIPSQLAAGGYLIRHEIVALHVAGAPQFYPSCAQLNVVGGGGQTPPSNLLVSIPGIYDNTQWPDIWTDTNLSSFIVPGPAVAFDSGGDGTPSPSGAIPSSSSFTSDVMTSSPSASSPLTSDSPPLLPSSTMSTDPSFPSTTPFSNSPSSTVDYFSSTPTPSDTLTSSDMPTATDSSATDTPSATDCPCSDSETPTPTPTSVSESQSPASTPADGLPSTPSSAPVPSASSAGVCRSQRRVFKRHGPNVKRRH